MPRNIVHLLRYVAGWDEARTQTTVAERALIRRSAPGARTIVELGAFEGVSSLALRETMDAEAELICIDPFPRSRAPLQVQEFIWRRQVGRVRNGSVRLIRQLSHQAVVGWTREIDLLFMDGDHTFEGVCRDFADWSRWLAPNGRILLHTSQPTPNKEVSVTAGPYRFVREVLPTLPAFRLDGVVDSISIIARSAR